MLQEYLLDVNNCLFLSGCGNQPADFHKAAVTIGTGMPYKVCDKMIFGEFLEHFEVKIYCSLLI